MALSRLEAEKRSLQEELGRIENRSTKLELQRMSTEGDLQRLQMMIQEKDATIQVIMCCVILLILSVHIFLEITRKVRSSESYFGQSGRTLHVVEVDDRPVEFVSGKGGDWRERIEGRNTEFAEIVVGSYVFVTIGGGKTQTSTCFPICCSF